MEAVIFPTVNDVGGGKVLSEPNLAALVRALAPQNFVVEGLEVAADTGLQLAVAAGVAVIAGHIVRVSAQPVTLSAERTWVGLALERDGLGSVLRCVLRVHTGSLRPAPDADEVPLAAVYAPEGAVDFIADQRPRDPGHRAVVAETPAVWSGDTVVDVQQPWARRDTFVWEVGGGRLFLRGYPSSEELGTADIAFVGFDAEGRPEVYVGESRVWTDTTAGWARTSPLEGENLPVYTVPGSRRTLDVGTEWVDLWAIRVPRGGQYQLSVEYEAVVSSGGSLEFKLATGGEPAKTWSTTLPASKTSSGKKDMPFMVPAGLLTLSARTGSNRAYIYPPVLYCAGYGAPFFSAEEVL